MLREVAGNSASSADCWVPWCHCQHQPGKKYPAAAHATKKIAHARGYSAGPMFDKQHLAMPTPVTPNCGNYGKHSKLAKWVYLLAMALLIGMFLACGGGSGGEANPVVDTALTITKQPSEQTVSIGQTATFTVEATGATGYQWKKNDSNISGATSSSYTTPPTTLQDQGAIYTVTASNSVRSAYSSGAKLTVAPDPAISTQPRSQSVVAGQSATFTVTASGTAPFSYQWKKNGTDILGATSSSYTTARHQHAGQQHNVCGYRQQQSG